MATLTFYGAVEGVTGSAYLLETRRSKVLLECGMFQGSREVEQANSQALPVNVEELNAVVLSHAHIDHSGRLPMLLRQGFSSSIYMTSPTLDLLEILLKDSASLQERDAEWENRRRRRAGKEEIAPLYKLEDVESTLDQCYGVDYGERIAVAEEIEIRFQDAGHILGSSIVEIFIKENDQTRKLVFSGDLGNSDAALLRDPAIVTEADVLLLETTYGDREHRNMDDTLEEFESIIEDATQTGGNILIPSFAVGRTQEIIFRLGEMYQQGSLRQQAVYLDSPMAIAVTEVYHRYQDVYNHEDRAAMQTSSTHKSLHRFLPVLRYSVSAEESMALNKIDQGAIIIAGSGMCNGGRIRHHFKHNLWRKQCHVIFVGYQAYGTPGRALVDGVRTFRLWNEEIAVKAQIHTLGGFSAHASQSQLTDWLENFRDSKPRVYLVHGETGAKQTFSEHISSKGWSAKIPAYGEKIEL